MGLLGKLFGSKPSIEKMQRALEQGNFAEALHLGEDLQAAGETTSALSAALLKAADGLSRLNLDEGLRFLAAGDDQLGVEHLQLALSQAQGLELIEEIESLIAQKPASELPPGQNQLQSERQAASGCGGCTPTPKQAEISAGDLPDLQAQIELYIASYPVELQERYLGASEDFLQAFLLIHTGDDPQALAILQEFPAEQQDDLYLFELGCLYGRLGERKKGIKLLRKALQSAPGHLLAIDALLQLEVSDGRITLGLDLLQQQLELGADPAFCFARQAELLVAAQEPAAALDVARKALDAGYAEAGFLLLAAGLLEDAGEDAAAEVLLSRLPGGGCGGGVNLPLAEFWLRRNRELAQVLDAFNGACRQEPENPRWQLRVAQTYLARKWRKQGLEILQRVVGDPRLEDHLRLEAEQLLSKG